MEKRDYLSPGKIGPTIINEGQPIEPIRSKLRDQTRAFDSGVRARTNFRRTLPGEGYILRCHNQLQPQSRLNCYQLYRVIVAKPYAWLQESLRLAFRSVVIFVKYREVST